jgi:nucleoid-associated protein YgaU
MRQQGRTAAIGILSFIASVGEKLVGAPDDKAAEQTWRQAALKNAPAKLGLPVTDFGVALNGEVAVLTGKVPSREVEEKIVLAVGKTAGVGSVVDDRLQVGASSAPTSASPSAPAAGASGEAASVVYTVKKGDNLSTIAKEHYGNASKYLAIFEANKPMLKDPDKIYVGQVLRIPPKP